jgi:hypothetical protein
MDGEEIRMALQITNTTAPDGTKRRIIPIELNKEDAVILDPARPTLGPFPRKVFFKYKAAIPP